MSATSRRARRRGLDGELFGLPRSVTAAALAAAAVAAAVIMLAGTGSSFHVDDWTFVTLRGGHSPDVFLRPHNEHLSLVHVTIYKALFETVGLDHFEVFRLVLVLVNLAGAGALLLLVARTAHPVVALLLCAPLLLMGAAWSALLSPFQMSFSFSMLAGLCSLLALDRRTFRGDVAAAALLTFALASAGLGLSWLVVVGVELVLRRRGLRRLWIVALPAAAYLAWYVVYGEHGERSLENPVIFAANAAAAVVGSYAGLDANWGRTLVVLGLLLAGWRVARLGRPPARTVAAAAGALTFWGLTGLVRDPATFGESRYLLAGAMFVVLAVGPLLPSRAPSRQVVSVAAAGVALMVLAGLPHMVAGRRALVDFNRPTHARLLAVEIAGERVDPQFQPDAVRSPHILAGPYLAAVDRYPGSPAMTVGEVRRSDAGTRGEFDQALVGALRLAFAPATAALSGPPPSVESGAAQTRGACIVTTGEPVAFRLPTRGLILEVSGAAEATLRLRRLGDGGEAAPALTAAAGGRAGLAIPPDRLAEPWRATLEGPAGTRACGTGG